jgi:hypothetical protein
LHTASQRLTVNNVKITIHPPESKLFEKIMNVRVMDQASKPVNDELAARDDIVLENGVP